MRDVARLAGVSHQTVSRVLNEPDKVRPATRERVQEVMTQLGYSRNLAARALVSGQSALVGVVWTGAHYFGPSKAVAGIEVAARSAGYSTLVGAVDADSEDDAAAVLESFTARGVDAIAVVAPYQRMLDLVSGQGPAVPTVLVGSVPEASGFHSVAVDQRLGARLAVRHLVESGARRIAHVSGPVDWFDAIARLDGWRQETVSLGAGLGERVVGDWSAESGYAAAAMLADDLPDAVFCANDLMAIGLAAGLRERGLLDRVRLVGFDDIDGADFMSPSLTTVRQPMAQLGAAAVETMVGAMAGQPPDHRALPPELIVRASSQAQRPANSATVASSSAEL